MLGPRKLALCVLAFSAAVLRLGDERHRNEGIEGFGRAEGVHHQARRAPVMLSDQGNFIGSKDDQGAGQKLQSDARWAPIAMRSGHVKALMVGPST
jgi:hypothetical protein